MNERELSMEEACDRLAMLRQRLGLEANILLANTQALVATCELYDKDYHEVSSGAGKGDQCELGRLQKAWSITS